MNRKLSNYYYQFHHHGKVLRIDDKDELSHRMDAISQQWEDEENDLGIWWLPVLDWDFTSSGSFFDMNKPDLADGSVVPTNYLVSELLGDTIRETCFLQPFADKVDEIESKFVTNK